MLDLQFLWFRWFEFDGLFSSDNFYFFVLDDLEFDYSFGLNALIEGSLIFTDESAQPLFPVSSAADAIEEPRCLDLSGTVPSRVRIVTRIRAVSARGILIPSISSSILPRCMKLLTPTDSLECNPKSPDRHLSNIEFQTGTFF